VGVTANTLRKRLRDHCNDKRRTHRTAWIQSLRKIGLRPIAEILETCEDHQRIDAEKAWILGFRQSGADLVNVTDGGEGTVGIKVSEETRSKMRAAKRRIPPERRSEISSLASKSRIGYKHKAETIEKIKKANTGQSHPKHTEEWKRQKSLLGKRPENIEHCRKMAESHKGIPRPPHVVEMMRARRHSQETKEKIRASAKNRKARV